MASSVHPTLIGCFLVTSYRNVVLRDVIGCSKHSFRVFRPGRIQVFQKLPVAHVRATILSKTEMCCDNHP